MGINDSDLMRLSFLLKEKTPGRSFSKNLHFKMILHRVYTKHHSSTARGLFSIGRGQRLNWFISAREYEYNFIIIINNNMIIIVVVSRMLSCYELNC